MSQVILTITDVPERSTINVTVSYPHGKHGPDNSLAEAVSHDFKAMLAGKLEDCLLEYLNTSAVRVGRLKLVVDNVTEVVE